MTHHEKQPLSGATGVSPVELQRPTAGMAVAPLQLVARSAGAFYLVTIVMGVFAELVVRGSVVVRDDAAATAANILARETFYRAGLAADLVMLMSYVAVTVLLYELLKRVGRTLSVLAAMFSLTGIAVLAVNCLNHLSALTLLKNNGYLGAFEPAELQALALNALRMHARAYNISAVFFGPYCVLIGYLVFKSRFLPRIVGVMMAIGGVAYLIGSFTGFIAPALSARLPDVTILGGLAELSLTLWLLVMGVKTSEEETR
jgi:hypothetical protein